MGRKKQLKAKVTHFPEADIRLGGRRSSIDPDRWTILANDCWQVVITSLNARQTLENNLELWYNLCDMTQPQIDTPYVDSSDLFIPLVPSKIEALRDQVAAITFVPEFYLVTGLTPDASESAYLSQAYWNNEFRKQRYVTPTWFQQHMNWLHLALRDGTAIMEVMWRKQTKLSRYGVTMPKIGEDGDPVMDGDAIVSEVHNVEKEVVEYNDVVMNVVKLKDFILIPDESTNLRDAVGCARVLWLYEDELRAMIADGLLEEEWVEKVLAYDPAGISDVAADRQRHYDKQVGNQLDIGMGQGVMSSEFFANRGPFKIWRMHTRQFDLDDDDVPEENIIWVHDQSGYMLGWCPNEYISPIQRPFFDLSPFPRPDEFYGFSLAERLGPFNAEANLMWNQRNDTINTRMQAPGFMNGTMEIDDKGMIWGNGKVWKINGQTGDLREAFFFPAMPDVPLASFQQESMVRNDADTIAGLNAPMTGGTNSGRRSAAEVKISSASGSVRANQIAMLLRLKAREVLEFARLLKLQYDWEPDPFGMPMDKQTLGKPYKMDVSGTSDPLDKQSSVDEALGAYNLLSQDRDIQQDAVHRYNLKRMVLERIGIPNIEAIIGSPDEAMQRKQGEAQQAEEMAAIQKQKAQADIAATMTQHPGEQQALQSQQQQGQQPPQGGPPQGGPPGPGAQNGGGALVGQ